MSSQHCPRLSIEMLMLTPPLASGAACSVTVCVFVCQLLKEYSQQGSQLNMSVISRANESSRYLAQQPRNWVCSEELGSAGVTSLS